MNIGRVRILELDGTKNSSGRSYHIEGMNLFDSNTKLPIVSKLYPTVHLPSINLTDVIGFGTNLAVEDDALQCDIMMIDSLWSGTCINTKFHVMMLANDTSVIQLIGIHTCLLSD